MTIIAFPGHAGRRWPLLGWRLVARISVTQWTSDRHRWTHDVGKSPVPYLNVIDRRGPLT